MTHVVISHLFSCCAVANFAEHWAKFRQRYHIRIRCKAILKLFSIYSDISLMILSIVEKRSLFIVMFLRLVRKLSSPLPRIVLQTSFGGKKVDFQEVIASQHIFGLIRACGHFFTVPLKQFSRGTVPRENCLRRFWILFSQPNRLRQP